MRARVRVRARIRVRTRVSETEREMRGVDYREGFVGRRGFGYVHSHIRVR